MKIIGALIGFVLMAIWFALRLTTFVAAFATGCLLILGLCTMGHPSAKNAFGAAGLGFFILVLIEMVLLGGRGLGRRNGGGRVVGYAHRHVGRFRPPGFF